MTEPSIKRARKYQARQASAWLKSATRAVSADALPMAEKSVDAAFLDQLTDDELEAAIAHELGHLWVFTHHPFLQTEELANQIAMRVVSRESLERVYGKVWARGGTKGDLNRFLGSTAAGLAPSN